MFFNNSLLALFYLFCTATVLPCPCSDRSLCDTIKVIPKKEIFIFITSEGPESWPLFDWSKITTISFSGSYKYVAELMCYCHRRSVRLVPLVDLGMPTKDLAVPAKRHQWVSKQVDYISQNYLDGINIDVEEAIHENQTAIRDGYTLLVLETKTRLMKLNPHSQVSVDVLLAPDLSPRLYDYRALALISDFFFVMDYDEGHSQPVSANSNYDSNRKGLSLYINQGIPSSKLVMGVPWYGYGWECQQVSKNFCFHPRAVAENSLMATNMERSFVARFEKHPENASPSYCYKDITRILSSQLSQGRLWNTFSQTPFFFFKDSSSKIRQMQYDDPESLSLKSALAVLMDLRGVGVWTGDCLDYSNTSEASIQRAAMWASLPVNIA